MSGRRVEVHIEELVLHGFPPLDRDAVADAVRRELATTLADRPELPGPVGPIRLTATALPDSLGGGIAAHIAERVPR